MDIQLFLAVNCLAISAIAILVLLIYRPVGIGSWLVVHGAAIAIAVAALLALPRWAGYAALAFFAPAVLVPSILSMLSMRRAIANRMPEAARLAAWAAVFHPVPRMRFNAAVLAAQVGDSSEQKAAALRTLAARYSGEQRTSLQVLEMRQRDDWAGIIDVARANPQMARELKGLEIRALGESGRPGPMIETYEAARAWLSGGDLHSALLFVLAFNGRVAAVDRLLVNNLRLLDADTAAYWRAIAERNAEPETSAWRDALAHLAGNAAAETVRRAAARQLANPVAPQPVMTRYEQEALSAAEDWVLRQPLRAAAQPRMALATFSLIAINLAAFAGLEFAGGSENLRTAVRWGGMWPPLVLDSGEWWRLGSALFLHFGALHLLVNMLMLYLLGRECEARAGPARMLTVYLVGGLASSGFVLAMMWARLSAPAVLMGASGAIFALIGYEVARRLVGWVRFREVLDGRGLAVIAAVMVVQFAVDMGLPQVSLSAHASGFVAGMLIGGLLDLSLKQRPA